MSTDISFAEPVRISTGTTVMEVRDARQAYEVLSVGWPDTRAKWYYAAVRACSSAMEGRTGSHVARQVFVEAARESRLHG